jgi:LemA protein
MKRKLFIPLAILGLLILYFIVTYNSLVKKEEKVKQDWSEVQNTYQRRLDLVPNLVSVVKGVSEFEKSVMVKITEARSRAAAQQNNTEVNAQNYEQQKKSQDSLAANVNRLIVLIEAYPELQATKAYLALQRDLVGTERRIVVARKDFNESVYNYNKKVKTFPTKLVAGILGFAPKEGFESDAGADKPVVINFTK